MSRICRDLVLDFPVDDKGNTTRVLQERVAKQRGVSFDEQVSNLKDVPELYGPEPVEMTYLLEIWMEISRTKNADIPMSYTDVKHYCDLTGTDMEPWEVESIFFYDRCWRATYADLRRKSTEIK